MSNPVSQPGTEWSKQQLAEEFASAGIAAGDNLILHSSYKSLGSVEDGPNGVIDALLSVIGPDAHLMVPTFTYSLPMWNLEPFDLVHSRSRTGAITEVLRRRPDAFRSFHPTHSVAMIGPRAEELTSNHLHATPIGLQSPFASMHELDARILMLGTFQDTNSSLHYCEVAAGLPYTEVAFSPDNCEIAWFLNENRQVEYTQIFEVPGCSRGFRKVEPLLRSADVLQDVSIAGAPSQLLNMRALVEAMKTILTVNPVILLCQTITCTICPKRRLHMASRCKGAASSR